jgi:5-methylcytosine-specific restriction enzyme A
MKLQTLKTGLATLKPSMPVLNATLSGAWRTDKQGANARGYTYKWQQASKGFLAKHPLCQCPDCDEGRKRVTPSTVVDHHIPHRGDMTLFWDRSNWRALSKPCHDAKTQREMAAGL